MRESESPVARVARQMRGSKLRLGAKNCTDDKFRAAAKAFWPLKTAEHWAHAAGAKGTRMARYCLKPGRAVTDSYRLAILRELLPPT